MTKRKFVGRVLVGEGRSTRRCCVAGCANVPPVDVLICSVHARALGGSDAA